MGDSRLPFDTVVELCVNRRRRIVLAVLANHFRPLTLRDLSGAVLKHQHGKSPQSVDRVETDRIRRSLNHAHVPKLVDVDFVEFERDRGLVHPTSRLRESTDAIFAIVDADPELDPPLDL